MLYTSFHVRGHCVDGIEKMLELNVMIHVVLATIQEPKSRVYRPVINPPTPPLSLLTECRRPPPASRQLLHETQPLLYIDTSADWSSSLRDEDAEDTVLQGSLHVILIDPAWEPKGARKFSDGALGEPVSGLIWS